MKTQLVKTLLCSFAVLLLTASLTFAQDSTTSKPSNHKHQMHMMKDSSGKMNMDMKGMQMNGSTQMNKKGNNSSIKEYKGVIDLKSVDLNKDGKVYQCPMDLNVFSDKPGVDPKCGMKLKEVSLKQAKNNLIKHGFKVK